MNVEHARTWPRTAIGPRVRKSPFFAATRRWGCNTYSVYNHMYMPLYYADPVTDFWRLVNEVTLWDVACERQVEISGPDAAAFTQYLTPRDLSACEPGQAKYAFLTNHHGNVINDPIILKLAPDRFWLSLADSDILLWAQGIALHTKWNVTVSEPDVSPLQVQGPKSPAVMTALFGDWISDLRYYWFRETELKGIPVLVSRTGWSSERGYEIFLRDHTRGDDLWEYIMAAGKPFNIAPGAPSAIRRIEAGMLVYGTEMCGDENPFELGWDRLVDLNQEDAFIGKNALERIKAKGITRRLCGLEIEGEALPGNEEPWRAVADGGLVGEVRSAVYSPRLEKNIALAMIDIGFTEIGADLEVATADGVRNAQVVEVPFYDPRKKLVTND